MALINLIFLIITKPDFILSDIRLQDESGLDLIKDIRAINYQIPIIVFTSFSNQEFLLEAANLGIDGYIIKPLELEEFFKVIFRSYNRITNIDENFY